MYKIIGGDGKEYGPVSADDLRRWIAEGRVNAQTRVQPQGGADWRPLGEFPELNLAALAAPLALPSPEPAKAPTFVKVFSILNMVFGGLGLICTPINFISIPLAMQTLGDSALMKGYLIFSSLWGFLGAIVLLASGIGLWKLRAWARKLAVWYSVLALVLGLAGLVVVLSAFGDLSAGNEMERAQKVGGIVGGVIGGVVGLAYNVLLIVFLSRQAAKQATGEIN